MPSHTDESPAKRRKIRKGTHSCIECRRRKVKCIFATPDSAVCITCERRGTTCTSQYDAVTSGVDATPDDESATCYITPESTTTSMSIARDSPKVHDAGFLAPIDQQITIQGPHAAIRDALLRALPCPEDIVLLSERPSTVSAICYQSDYRANGPQTSLPPDRQLPVKTLLQPELHPALLARQMLLFAAALQNLSPREAIPGLTEHHHTIMKGLAEAAIKIVNTDDTMLTTLESLEILIFEVFYHVDSGNIRRAWTTCRRAVTAAQMLGLNQIAEDYRFEVINHDSDIDPVVVWSTIVSLERFYSLLLGLPTSTGHATLASQTVANDLSLGNNLTALTGSLAGKILERNQSTSLQQTSEATAKIDQEFINASEEMPAAFWRPLAFNDLPQDSREALTETRRAFGQMCYYSLVVQLHLPEMLSSRSASSTTACVSAAREVLVREIELRAFDALSAKCRLSDFMALVAGIALVLGHVTGRGAENGNPALTHQRLGDRAIVERALESIEAFAEGSGLHGDVHGMRSADLLRGLLAIEEQAARHSRLLRSGAAQELEQSQADEQHVLVMRSRGLDSLQISRYGVSVMPGASVAKERARIISHGVSIGGIGSMLLLQSTLSTPDQGHGKADMSSLVSPLTNGVWNPTQHGDGAAEPLLVMPETSVDQTSVDSHGEWTLDDLDTGFMEALLRENDFSNWDIVGDREAWDNGGFAG